MNGEGTVLSSSSFFPSHFLRSVFPFLQSWQIVEINRVRLLNLSIFFLFDFSKILFFFLQEESRDWSLNFLKPSSVYLPGISPRFVAPADSAKYAALRSRPPETSVEFHPFWATARLAREILFPATNPPARP